MIWKGTASAAAGRNVGRRLAPSCSAFVEADVALSTLKGRASDVRVTIQDPAGSCVEDTEDCRVWA